MTFFAERLAITKKKLDDSVVKGVELQNNNSVFSDKNEIFNKECEKVFKINFFKKLFDSLKNTVNLFIIY